MDGPCMYAQASASLPASSQVSPGPAELEAMDARLQQEEQVW